MQKYDLENEVVTYELALEMKALGFNEDTICLFNSHLHLKGQIISGNNGDYIDNDKFDNRLLAPTYRQAFRWFRKKYKLNGEVTYLPNIEKYVIIISDMRIKPKDLSKGENLRRSVKVTNNFAQYDIYEEAELVCLKKLIEVVKNRENEH